MAQAKSSTVGALDKEWLLAFVSRHRLGVIASAGRDGSPEAALVDFAVTPAFEIVFETTDATRKFPNLKNNPQAEMVIGWDDNQTLQCHGDVDEPEGREGERVRAAYLATFPEKASHRVWPGNCYFRLRPSWIRFSDYNPPRKISEMELPAAGHPKKPAFWRMFEGFKSGGARRLP